MIEEFVYEGWMGQEAQKFFEGNCIREERDGCATVGSFIRLANGKTHLPSKGDKFTSCVNVYAGFVWFPQSLDNVFFAAARPEP